MRLSVVAIAIVLLLQGCVGGAPAGGTTGPDAGTTDDSGTVAPDGGSGETDAGNNGNNGMAGDASTDDSGSPSQCEMSVETIDACKSECVGFEDADGDENNGCECPTNPTFTLEVLAEAVANDCASVESFAFVASSNQNGSGTPDDPYGSLERAIKSSVTSPTIIIVSNDDPLNGLQFDGATTGDAEIYGGYSQATGWERDGERSLVQRSRGPAAVIRNLTNNDSLTLRDLAFSSEAGNEDDKSSYTFAIIDVAEGALTLENVEIVGPGAAHGDPGTSGQTGASGTPGGNGSQGNTTSPNPGDGGTSNCGAAGGDGGTSRRPLMCGSGGPQFTRALPGSAGSPLPIAGSGGLGGLNGCASAPSAGLDGSNGGPGQSGSHGVPASNDVDFTFQSGALEPALPAPTNANPGSSGGGGGGGGGGGTVTFAMANYFGASGSGGGAGGCGGEPGEHGERGTDSIAVVVVRSTVDFGDTRIVRGTAGDGGNGASGGCGGIGMPGGSRIVQGRKVEDIGGDVDQSGGAGGRGGNGGPGGSGAGGNGGHSIAIFGIESDLQHDDVSILGGEAGDGGDGGRTTISSPAGTCSTGPAPAQTRGEAGELLGVVTKP